MALALGAAVQELQASQVADQFVKGLDYPIAKTQIVNAARDASLGPAVQEALNKIPDREYADAED
ncbi:MAG: DUF2795 domain-containing protein, partial [Chloroflexi bacterium]